MGEIRTIATISNPLISDGSVLEIDACVDTGAVMLLLGKDIVDRLQFQNIGRAVVTLADDSKKEMDKAGPILLKIGDRQDYFSCLVGPVGCEPLVGQVIMGTLDLVADCGRQALKPRPESPAYPSYKLK